MILDKLSECAVNQSIGASGYSDIIDLGGASIDAETPLALVIQMTAAATAAGAATVSFSLESDTTANLATTPTVLWKSPAIGVTTLVEEYVVARFLLPVGGVQRYLGVRHTVTDGPLLTGNYRAFLTPAAAFWQPQADAVS